jgi:hypothetical protein
MNFIEQIHVHELIYVTYSGESRVQPLKGDFFTIFQPFLGPVLTCLRGHLDFVLDEMFFWELVGG